MGEKLSANESKIVALIENNKNNTIAEMASKLKISSTAVENNLNKLKSKGIVSRIGGDKGGHWEIVGKQNSQ